MTIFKVSTLSTYLLWCRENRLELAEEDLRAHFLIKLLYPPSNILGFKFLYSLNEDLYG